jgi:serine-type D-Ala-D-Ala carboxypeptidase/endopeptidase (penicillin-binding protein 4)
MVDLFATALVAALSSWTPDAVARASVAIDRALAAPTLRGAHVGLLAVDADSGTLLYARNAGDDFVPASTFKLLTGSVALAQLGPAFTFVTQVRAQGGTVFLRGGGDAQLDLDDLDAAAAAVAATGSTSVAMLAGDASRYDAPRYPGGWQIDDLPQGYAAVASALSFDDNVAHVRVLPGDAVGAPTSLRVAPRSEAFSIENAAITGSKTSQDTTDVARPWDKPATIRVFGSYPLGAPPSDDLEPAVPDPPAYALDLFAQALARHGVTVGGLARGLTPSDAGVVWTHRSAPLAEVLPAFWQPSDNLIGELLLLELGQASTAGGGTDTRARGIAAEAAWLASIGIDPATVTIADGSGLSTYDRITPRALVAILEADWHGAQRDTVLAALPLAGVRGTLKSSFVGTPAQGAVFAKTGSMNHARLLAGFARTKRRGTVAFALMVNDWMDASPGAAAALERARAAVLAELIGT